MADALTIVVPMKVWTPGLHAFRSKHLHSNRALIPPHVELLSISGEERGVAEDRILLGNRLTALCQSFSTFGYSLT